MKKIEDSSCSLPSQFWRTSQSPFSTCYRPFQKLRKSRIQRFKPCTIWSWNEEDMAFGRQHLQACAKFAQHLQLVRSLCETRTTLAQHLQLVRSLCETRTTPSACAKLVRNSHNTFKIRTIHAWCEFSSVFADSTLDLFLCIFFLSKFLSYPCN